VEMLCDLLKEIRNRKDWSQEDLARRLEVSLSTLQRWESDRCSPSRVYRKELTKLFNEVGVSYSFNRRSEGTGQGLSGQSPGK